MPTSDPGSESRGGSRGPRGFTLVELLIVIAIVALSAALISLSLPDADRGALQRDAQRLVTLLESARAESRATGVAVHWQPVAEPRQGFVFAGLPGAGPARAWLDDRVRARVVDAEHVVLGPEALVGSQRIVLSLADQRLVVGTDGLAPFAVVDDQGSP